MSRSSPLARLIADERRRQSAPLRIAGLCAAGAAVGAAALLGLSGWFIAAAAGAAGAAMAFNYVLPSAAIRLLAIVRTAGRYGEQASGHEAALKALARIRPEIFRSLAAAPPSQALALSIGEASARFIQDVDCVENRFVRLSGRWAAAASFMCGVALTGLAGWPVAAATAALFAIVLFGSRVLTRRLSVAPGRQAQVAGGRVKDSFAALFAAAPELRCLGLEAWAVRQVSAEAAGLDQARRDGAPARAWQGAFPAAMAALAAAAALALGAAAGAPLAVLAALVAAVTVEGAGALARGLSEDGAAAEAERRLDPILRAGGGDPGAPAPVLAEAGIILELGGQRVVAAGGARIGVVGRSGCGKTTLLEQLIGLRETPPGVARIAGRDVSLLPPQAVRALFAYAPQEPSLLSGSFRDNLSLGAPQAGDDALWSALADACLDARVRAAPGGLDAWIGEGGERLSGGERRRLCVARALVANTPWLILDEPTEGLDPETEARLTQRLGARLDRTGQGLIMVSHRPRALALCAQVFSAVEPQPPPLARAA